MRVVFCASALLLLVAFFVGSPRNMFTAAPAAQRAALVSYARPSDQAQLAAYPANAFAAVQVHRPPVPGLPAREVRVAALALMPQNQEPSPAQPAPRLKIYWSRVFMTACLFGVLGYLGTNTDLQSADNSVISTISKWLAESPIKEVPAPHYDEFGVPVGKQTRPGLNGGSVVLLATTFPARALMLKAQEKYKAQEKSMATRSLEQEPEPQPSAQNQDGVDEEIDMRS